MKSISIYDEDDIRIDELCEKYDMMPYEIIEMLLDYIEYVGENEVFE